MTKINELPACAQKVVLGAMSRAIIENLFNTAPFARDDLSFAENVYAQWTGSDQLIKEFTGPESGFLIDGVIEKHLTAFKVAHPLYVELFNDASSALDAVVTKEVSIRETAITNGPSFFSKPDLPSAYKAHIVSILRKLPEVADLELLDDDEIEEWSDSEADESDDSDAGEGEESSGDDDDDEDDDDDDNDDDENGDEKQDGSGEDSDSAMDASEEKRERDIKKELATGPSDNDDDDQEVEKQEEQEEEEEEEEDESEEEESEEEESEEEEEESEEEDDAPKKKRVRV
jgi:hypothetical protein